MRSCTPCVPRCFHFRCLRLLLTSTARTQCQTPFSCHADGAMIAVTASAFVIACANQPYPVCHTQVYYCCCRACFLFLRVLLPPYPPAPCTCLGTHKHADHKTARSKSDVERMRRYERRSCRSSSKPVNARGSKTCYENG